MTNRQIILRGENLRKQFKVRTNPAAPTGLLTAVDDVSIELYRGEILGIAGESGCGKSTLGKVLAGLVRADYGKVICAGTDIATMSSDAKTEFRRRTQMIFQDPFSSLNPRMRIGDSITEPLLLAGSSDAVSRRSRAEAIMETVGLSAALFDRFPHEFSGGQRQRIGIARALASSPVIIIADEPVSSLDVSIQAQIINLLQSMQAQYNLSLAVISHDLSVLRHICSRVVIMYLGIIVESAPAQHLFSRCLHPYTEALISAIPRLDRKKGDSPIVLKGDIPSPLNIPEGCRFHPRCPYARELCRLEVPKLEEKQPQHWAACHFSNSLFLAE